MTRITIYKSSLNGEIAGFRTDGHAGFHEAGKDIVCAAISTLTINTVNSIEQFTEDEFEGTADEEKAIITFRLKSHNISNECLVLLKAYELGVTQLAKTNSKYISITFEEV